jgi:hypothetical protein
MSSWFMVSPPGGRIRRGGLLVNPKKSHPQICAFQTILDSPAKIARDGLLYASAIYEKIDTPEGYRRLLEQVPH